MSVLKFPFSSLFFCQSFALPAVTRYLWRWPPPWVRGLCGGCAWSRGTSQKAQQGFVYARDSTGLGTPKLGALSRAPVKIAQSRDLPTVLVFFCFAESVLPAALSLGDVLAMTRMVVELVELMATALNLCMTAATTFVGKCCAVPRQPRAVGTWYLGDLCRDAAKHTVCCVEKRARISGFSPRDLCGCSAHGGSCTSFASFCVSPSVCTVCAAV